MKERTGNLRDYHCCWTASTEALPDTTPHTPLARHNIIIPHLVLLYNTILATGVFPDEWGKDIIHRLHKCGDINTRTNFRGISLLSVTSKIFTKLLNERLVKWAESEHAYYDEQAGFSKGF